MTSNSLEQVDPQSIDTLLERDPENLTLEESESVAQYLADSLHTKYKDLAKRDAQARKNKKWGKGPLKDVPEDADLKDLLDDDL